MNPSKSIREFSQYAEYAQLSTKGWGHVGPMGWAPPHVSYVVRNFSFVSFYESSRRYMIVLYSFCPCFQKYMRLSPSFPCPYSSFFFFLFFLSWFQLNKYKS